MCMHKQLKALRMSALWCEEGVLNFNVMKRVYAKYLCHENPTLRASAILCFYQCIRFDAPRYDWVRKVIRSMLNTETHPGVIAEAKYLLKVTKT